MPDAEDILRFEQVGVVHPGDPPVQAVRDVDLAIAPGEFLALLGPTGSGKTTLLDTAAGLLAPTSGRVRYGPGVTPGRNVQCVFQQYTLFPWRTVERNVAFAAEMRGAPKRKRLADARELLERVGLGDRADALPHELSGGMRQRAAIAQALAAEPRLLLMDEPFGALDAATRPALRELVLDIRRERDTAVLFVTHDIDEALLLADRVVVLSGRPGTVAGEIRLDAPRPRDPASRAFVEQHLAARALLGGSVV